MPDFPAHASPAYTPVASPHPRPHQNRNRTVSELKLSHDDDQLVQVPPPLVSPAFTPPRTPEVEGAGGQRHDRRLRSIPVPEPEQRDAAAIAHDARFKEELPEVVCQVRARLPTTMGTEMYLHLYHNSVDDKEHLAIVFGPHIKSKSLHKPRQGETEMQKMTRGAYDGTLYPGRQSSRIEQVRSDAGVGRGRPSAAYLAQANDTGHRRGTGEQNGEDEEVEVPGYPAELEPPLVRIHSECYTGETVWSARCDCGEQLDEAARLMSLPVAPTPGSTPGSESSAARPILERGLPAGGGVIIYLRQEGRGIGLLSKLKAYNLQDLGHDTMEANLLLRHPGDARSYGLATAMLMDLGLGGEKGIKLLTNNPEKVRAVEGPHREVRVVERVPMIPLAWKTGGKEGINSPEVEKYIETKIGKFHHMFG